MSDSQKIKIETILVTLKRLDDIRLHVRDAAVLYYIIKNPGANRNEIARALGLHAEVNVLHPVKRLTRDGLIEDRRERTGRAISSLLHATEKGHAVWQGVIR